MALLLITRNIECHTQQSIGQIIGEVLRRLDEDRFIVKASSGPRYVVGCRTKVNGLKNRDRNHSNSIKYFSFGQVEKEKLVSGTRVALDMTTLTIMRMLPREVDPTVYHMVNEDPGAISFASIGGLNDQIRELREVINKMFQYEGQLIIHELLHIGR
jgi:26S proteasome regulatory subunit T4